MGPYRGRWGWFDPHHDALLRRLGVVSGTEVLRTPRTADIPGEVLATMADTGARTWDEPWRTAVTQAFRTRQVIATPITEYLADRVTHGRVAVLGDAAHAQTPMTGAGFQEAVADAATLATALSTEDSPEKALQQYELTRLADMRRRVAGGQSFSRSFAGR